MIDLTLPQESYTLMSKSVPPVFISRCNEVFLSTAYFIRRGKLVSLKVFPLMYLKRSIFPLAVSCKPWQLALSPLRWIQCYSPTAVRSHQPDRQLPGKRFSQVQAEP